MTIISPVTGIGQVAALALQLEGRLRPRLRRRVAIACQAGRAAQRLRQLGNVGGDLGPAATEKVGGHFEWGGEGFS